jgi:hypothetical protein
MGWGGGALGAPLWVALLSVLSRSGWNEADRGPRAALSVSTRAIKKGPKDTVPSIPPLAPSLLSLRSNFWWPWWWGWKDSSKGAAKTTWGGGSCSAMLCGRLAWRWPLTEGRSVRPPLCAADSVDFASCSAGGLWPSSALAHNREVMGSCAFLGPSS